MKRICITMYYNVLQNRCQSCTHNFCLSSPLSLEATVCYSVPQDAADLVRTTFAIGLFSFMPGSILASPSGVFKITFAMLILFALVGIHCPLVYE
jgi:hypothetical protein